MYRNLIWKNSWICPIWDQSDTCQLPTVKFDHGDGENCLLPASGQVGVSGDVDVVTQVEIEPHNQRIQAATRGNMQGLRAEYSSIQSRNLLKIII